MLPNLARRTAHTKYASLFDGTVCDARITLTIKNEISQNPQGPYYHTICCPVGPWVAMNLPNGGATSPLAFIHGPLRVDKSLLLLDRDRNFGVCWGNCGAWKGCEGGGPRFKPRHRLVGSVEGKGERPEPPLCLANVRAVLLRNLY